MIIVNFKRYVSGEKTRELMEICKRVSEETGVRIVAAVTDNDWQEGCWSQKFWRPDVPTLLNHSDYPLEWEILEVQCLRLKELKTEVCICCATVEEGVKISKLQPEWVAYEPRELIGSREKSVSSEHAEEVRRLVGGVTCPVLIGAGVHNAWDVKVALELGAKGILVATDVVKAVEPEKELRELAGVFR